MDRVEGGCLCGAVRITAEGQPDRVGLCHCMDCRKHHGAVFFAAAIFPEDAVTIRGETRAWEGGISVRAAAGRCFPSATARWRSTLGRWMNQTCLSRPMSFGP